jgi:hypothetical protein
MPIDYYEESIALALEDQGISATAEQIAIISETLKVSASNESMYRGHDCIPNPLEYQMKEQERGHQRTVSDYDKRMQEKNKYIEELCREIRHLRSDLYDAKQGRITP